MHVFKINLFPSHDCYIVIIKNSGIRITCFYASMMDVSEMNIDELLLIVDAVYPATDIVASVIAPAAVTSPLTTTLTSSARA